MQGYAFGLGVGLFCNLSHVFWVVLAAAAGARLEEAALAGAWPTGCRQPCVGRCREGFSGTV